MPIWGWLCVGILVLVVVAIALLYLFIIVPSDRKEKRIREEGQDAAGLIILANPSAYEKEMTGFEFAFVLFTLDERHSDSQLDFLRDIHDELQEFEADEDKPDELKLAWALDTQRTIDDVVRVPKRISGKRATYFTTISIKRDLLPKGRLTRDYLYLRVIPEGPHRGAFMIEYPDSPGKGK
jgi:hypothetical protein